MMPIYVVKFASSTVCAAFVVFSLKSPFPQFQNFTDTALETTPVACRKRHAMHTQQSRDMCLGRCAIPP